MQKQNNLKSNKNLELEEELAKSPVAGSTLDRTANSKKIQQLSALIGHFPSMNAFMSQFGAAIENTVDFFEKNNIPDNVQYTWLNLVENIGKAINMLGMRATAYSASRKSDADIPGFKQKTIQSFKTSPQFAQVTKDIAAIKKAGVDTNIYEKLLSSGADTIVDGIFGLNAQEMSEFASKLNISNEFKTQLNTVISSNKDILSSPNVQKQTEPITPAVAQQLANDFKQYMEAIKNKYGEQSFQVLNQQMQQLMKASQGQQK